MKIEIILMNIVKEIISFMIILVGVIAVVSVIGLAGKGDYRIVIVGILIIIYFMMDLVQVDTEKEN